MGGDQALHAAADGGAAAATGGSGVVGGGALARRRTRHDGPGCRNRTRTVRPAHAVARELSRHPRRSPPGGHGRRAAARAGLCRAQRDLRASRSARQGIRGSAHTRADAARLRPGRTAVPACPAGQRAGRRPVSPPRLRDASRAGDAVATTDVAAVHGSRVVWTAFVVAVFGFGVGFYGPGIYLVALHRSHGWPIATISLAITAHFLTGALLVTLLPDVYRRFGAAAATVSGAALAAAGAIAWTEAREVWQLVPALLLSGAGWSAMSGAALNLIVAPWFERDRAWAISTAFNGASIGGLLFAPLWTALIAHAGLEAAGAMVAFATVTVVCPLAWVFLRREPSATTSK